MEQQRIDLKIGDRVFVTLPWSEVCAHMQVADRVMEVEVREHGAQLLKDGEPYSMPITWDEAGIYTDQATGEPYTYNAEKTDPDTRGCSCGMADYGAPGHDGDPNNGHN